MYKPKIESFVKLSRNIENEEQLRKHFDKLSKSPTQLNLLMIYIQQMYDNKPIADRLNKSEPNKILTTFEISKADLLKRSNSTSVALNSLINKNIFEIVKRKSTRLESFDNEIKIPNTLNEHQQKAFAEIKNHFETKDVVLLHGITSCGKTEIYIHLIEETIKRGKQVLYLLPEIALTTQIINRLRNIFGSKVGVYHSKFSDAERGEVWEKVGNYNIEVLEQSNHVEESFNEISNYNVILGVRSSVFLPFSNLGLIIVDEEHENTYKQFDPAPRYHARDASIVLAKLHNAKVLLGTATPAVETYYNAIQNKYGLVEIFQRYKDIQLPEILIADVKEAERKKQMKSDYSPLMFDSIKTALDNKEQVIIFQNRRGFSPYMECSTCGWIPKCENCDVSLTYHKRLNQLVCHYCGYVMNLQGSCLACGDTAMKTCGFGTEKIEDEINLFFSEARIARLDLDTTRNKKSHETIIKSFENKDVDILIGTQMVSKGLDFDNVSIVGIMNADSLINFPDFRSLERSFQLMAQVSGRAGRSGKRGKVVIQTTMPKHHIIEDVIKNDYINMFNRELRERQQFKYPPFYRLIEIMVKHKKQSVADYAAKILADNLRTFLGRRVLGPEYPLINRIQNWFQKRILIKVEADKSLSKVKEMIQQNINQIKVLENLSTIQIVVDVDPM